MWCFSVYTVFYIIIWIISEVVCFMRYIQCGWCVTSHPFATAVNMFLLKVTLLTKVSVLITHYKTFTLFLAYSRHFRLVIVDRNWLKRTNLYQNLLLIYWMWIILVDTWDKYVHVVVLVYVIWQVLQACVSNWSGGAVRKTSGLWKHASQTRTGRIFTCCHHTTRPEWVKTRAVNFWVDSNLNSIHVS